MTRLTHLRLERYGVFEGTDLALSDGLTVVMGSNEAGKSTALCAVADLLWGIPLSYAFADVLPRPKVRIRANVAEAKTCADGESQDQNLPRSLRRTIGGLLDDEDSRPVDNPWGADGAESRSSWLSEFGLSHESLRAGGRAVCSGSGDLAKLIFTARRGPRIPELLGDLDQRADKLYKDHGNAKGVEVRKALAEYRRAHSDRDAALVRSSTVQTAEARVKVAEEGRRLAVESAESALRAITVLREHGRCFDDAAKLRAVRGRLSAVMAEGPHFDRSALARLDAIRSASKEWAGQESELHAQISEWTAERDALTVDRAVLDDAVELDDLKNKVVARTGDRDRATTLGRAAGCHEQDARASVAQLTGAADSRSTQVILESLHIPADTAAQLDTAAVQRIALLAAVDATRAKVDEAQVAVDRLDELHTLPNLEAVAPLAQALAGVETDDSPAKQLRSAQRRGVDARARSRQALSEAGWLDPDTEPTSAPSSARVQALRKTLEKKRYEQAEAAKSVATAQGRSAGVLQRLRADAAADVPNWEHLTAARADRDSLWQLIRGAWLQQAPRDRLQDPRALAGEYERRVVNVDDLVDRLHAQADRVAEMTILRRAAAEAAHDTSEREALLDLSTTECARAEGAWTALWVAGGVAVPSLTEAETVRHSLETAVTAANDAKAADDATATLLPEVRAVCEHLRQLLAAHGVCPLPIKGDRDGMATLEAAVEASRALLDDVDHAREARQERKTAVQALTTAQRKGAEAERSMGDGTTEWAHLLLTAKLASGVDPVGWVTRRDHLRTAVAEVDAAAALRAEQAPLQAGWDALVARVDTLKGRHSAGGDTRVALDTLCRRLSESRANDGIHTDRSTSVGQAEQKLREVQRRSARCGSDRDDLYRAQRVDCSQAEAAIARGEVARGLHDDEQELVRQLGASVDPGNNPEQLIAILADTDRATLDSRQQVADMDRHQAEDARELAITELADARRELETLQVRGDAAQLNAKAQEQLAKVAHLTEQYAIVNLQRLMLRDVLHAEAQQHASPLLTEAGALLNLLTGGRWVAMRAHDDSAEGRGLSIVRADGETCTAQGLSEGTADQVFLALRLAGILQRQADRVATGKPPLPVMLDDVLMAFDDQRAAAALRLLANLASDAEHPLQIVLFTHHQHIADLAAKLDSPAATIVTMARPEALTSVGDPNLLATEMNAGSIPRPRGDSTDDPADLRAWARDQGLEVSARGRIPRTIAQQYRLAHP